MNKKLLKLLLLPCLILPSFSCGNNGSISNNSSDGNSSSINENNDEELIKISSEKKKELTNVLIEQFGTKAQCSYGFELSSGAYLISAYSPTFEDNYRDVISNYSYVSNNNYRIFIIKDSKIYSLKEGFLNLYISLNEIEKFNSQFGVLSTYNGGNIDLLINDQIVLDKKIKRNYSINDDLTRYYNDISKIKISIDSNFISHEFTKDDFKTEYIASIDNITSKYNENDFTKPFLYGQVYILTLNTSKENIIIDLLNQLNNLYFVNNACISNDYKSVYEFSLQTFNDKLNVSDVEIIKTYNLSSSYGVVNIYSEEGIEKSFRKETFIKYSFNYGYHEQTFIIKDNEIYTLKEAFTNLIISYGDLCTLIDNMYINFDSITSHNYSEIGEETIYELSKFDSWEHFDYDYEFYKPEEFVSKIEVYIDNNFRKHVFTLEDFKNAGFNLTSIEWLTENINSMFLDGSYIYTDFAPHQKYLLTVNTTDQKEVIDIVNKLIDTYFISASWPYNDSHIGRYPYPENYL